MKSLNIREHISQLPLFQLAVFTIAAATAGVFGWVYADEYVTDRALYEVARHESKGTISHLEFQANHFASLVGQLRIRISIIRTEKRDWESRIFTRRNSTDTASQEAVQLYRSMIEELDEELGELNTELTSTTKRRVNYLEEIRKRPQPEKP